MTGDTQLGLALQKAALRQSADGRKEAIQMVRAQVVRSARADHLSADDVQDAVDLVGCGAGDRRWTANVLRGWALVRCTDAYVTSRRSQNHGRKIPEWRWV